MEETNARYVTHLPEAVTLVTVDASFISLKVLLPVMRGWFAPAPTGAEAEESGDLVALIKPQFEAGRAAVRRGDGVVRDPAIHIQVLTDILDFATTQGFRARGMLRSPLLGPKGNAEFLAWLALSGDPLPNLPAVIALAVNPPGPGEISDAT
jgi:23S rRNA (cytidine1920-2'-O)/16S rRNA (cytidine1409-2'-O)-methyltransferase